MMGKSKQFSVIRILLVAILLALTTIVSTSVLAEDVDYEDVLPKLTINTDGTLVDKALVGKAVKAPTAVASDDLDGSLEYTLTVFFNESEDITNANASLDYVMNKAGVYTFYYETVNSRNLFAFKKFTCDVRSEWLTIDVTTANILTGYVGVEIEIAGFTVKDFHGQVVGDSTNSVEVYLDTLKIDSTNNKFTPTLKGTYRIIYKATKNTETVTLVNEVEVIGSRPTIAVNNVPNRGKVNVEATLPTAVARDSEGDIIQFTVEVMFNGAAIEVKDNKFTPTSVGKYIIKYSAKDKNDISNFAEFEFEAVDDTAGNAGDNGDDEGCGSTAFGFGNTMILLVVSFCAFILAKTKKNRNKTSSSKKK